MNSVQKVGGVLSDFLVTMSDAGIFPIRSLYDPSRSTTSSLSLSMNEIKYLLHVCTMAMEAHVAIKPDHSQRAILLSSTIERFSKLHTRPGFVGSRISQSPTGYSHLRGTMESSCAYALHCNRRRNIPRSAVVLMQLL